MADLNNCSIIGRLTADAERREVGANGIILISFNLANNTGFGQYACTNFFRVNAWGKQADAVYQYLTKGKQVGVTGTMENKKWTDNNGQSHDQWTITVTGPITLLASPQGIGNNAASMDAVPPDAMETF